MKRTTDQKVGVRIPPGVPRFSPLIERFFATEHPVAPTLCIAALQEFLAKSCLKRNRLDSDNLGLRLWMLIEEPRAWL